MVYLVHHGDAVGPDVDPMRPLSDAGRAGMLLVADAAARRHVKPVAIWHSGKLRARQTAEIFWQVCHAAAILTAERALQPGDPPEWISDRLIGETRDLMVVGHMPHLLRLLRLMVGEDPDSSALTFPMHGMIALVAEGDQWKEMWRLDRLGRSGGSGGSGRSGGSENSS